MKKTLTDLLVLGGMVLGSAAAASAASLPPGSKVFRELDCTAQLSGGTYAGNLKVTIVDVTYKVAGAGWDNYSSALELTLSNGSVLTGVMNESNGVDPQEYRDSAPTEYSGYGGLGLYPISKNGNNQYVIAMTRSALNQRDLPVRSYQFTVGLVDENFQQVGTPSEGSLTCNLKK